MIRVLQCVNNMHRAGLETMLMNYYRHMDRNEIQFDFLTHRPERADYDDEIERLGGRVFHAPRLYPQHCAAYYSYMKAFFREHPEYQIVHAHIDAMSFMPLMAAKLAGVPVRIAHSHSTSIDRDWKYGLKQALRLMLPAAAGHYFACGQQAGEFLFRGRAFEVIPNAVAPERFCYDEQTRQHVRSVLGWEGKTVLGHVGRFCYAKNHDFLLDAFAKALQADTDARLLLIGSGELEDAVRARVAALGLGEQVIFLGSRADVAPFYQAMDVFVMPSNYEGIPLTGVEAQYAGLPCVFSDRVPEEVAFTDRCSFLPLERLAEDWAAHILAQAKENIRTEKIRDGRFDIHVAAGQLAEKYRQLLMQHR